jgi:anti-sigma B factor antagonist
MTITQEKHQTTADRGAGIEILGTPSELDLLTADGLAEQARAAIARHPWLLLLDLTSLFFCDARGLSALVRIANHADPAGCRYGLIGPQPPVAKLLRVTGLNDRMPVFATIEDALAHFTALASAPAGTKPWAGSLWAKISTAPDQHPGGRRGHVLLPSEQRLGFDRN